MDSIMLRKKEAKMELRDAEAEDLAPSSRFTTR
jgi:hypothetical protein